MNPCGIPNPLKFLQAAALREHQRAVQAGKFFVMPCYCLSSVETYGTGREIILRDILGRRLTTYRTKQNENGRWLFWRE